MPPTRLPRKKDVAVALLEQSSVFVHLDPRAERVSVPPWLKRQPQLVLQIGLNMAIPIHDLHLDEESMSCTLSFQRSPHYCVVPWNSVYALVGEDGRGMVWPDDVPPEVAAQMQQKAAPKPKLAAVGPAPAEKATADQAPARTAEKASAGKAASGGKSGGKRAAAEKKAATAAAKEAKPAAKKKRSRRKTKAEAVQEPAAKPEAVQEPAQRETLAGGAKGKRQLPPYLRVIK